MGREVPEILHSFLQVSHLVVVEQRRRERCASVIHVFLRNCISGVCTALVPHCRGADELHHSLHVFSLHKTRVLHHDKPAILVLLVH